MILEVFPVFPDFEDWVKEFKVFDLRFGFLVKNCVYFTPGTPQKNSQKKGLIGGG